MVISVYYNQYDNNVINFNHKCVCYPAIYIFSKDHLIVNCQAKINDRTIIHIKIYFWLNHNSYIEMVTEGNDDYGNINIEGTPIYHLLSEIADLYDKEYDRTLFNDYVLNLHDITKQLEYRIASSFDDFINLNLISNTKSAK